jgi:hypothetical protein
MPVRKLMSAAVSCWGVLYPDVNNSGMISVDRSDCCPMPSKQSRYSSGSLVLDRTTCGRGVERIIPSTREGQKQSVTGAEHAVIVWCGGIIAPVHLPFRTAETTLCRICRSGRAGACGSGGK